ncbi:MULTISPECIES: hypothetical protein [Pseudoalteromonas]|uniref:hypothetical protein n=1 Tax=Pseudoalteromonas TaxID=53246 RepID=UPI001EF4DF48|nr:MULTISPECIES: hypothetical protein [Pseudoalteromonas]MCG7564619.1 hypothetical protein [Pseudoalteromonas sp. McH1-42]MEC4091924.1 hypothetical protein [Pseudoalteromonas rubra]
MEVKFGIGLGNIRFGVDQVTLKRLIGEPNKIDTDNDGLLLLQYNKLKCTFWMDETDRLHWIQCSNPTLLIQGVNIIGLEVLVAISKLKVIIETPFEFEDYGSMESYSFPEQELEIQSEYGVVTTVCFGHFWKDDEPLYTNA